MEHLFIDTLEPRQFMSVNTLVTYEGVTTTQLSHSTIILATLTRPKLPQVVNGVIQINGSHNKNDDYVITRSNGGALPATTRYLAVLKADGTLEFQNGYTKGPLLNSPPQPGSTASGTVLLEGDYIHIQNGSNDFYIQAAGITGVRVSTGGGNDRVIIGKNLKLSTTLLGGDGNDTLFGSSRADLIDGNDGDDVLNGGGAGSGQDTIIAGDGQDSVTAASFDEVVAADDGEVDTIIKQPDSSTAAKALTLLKIPKSRLIQIDMPSEDNLYTLTNIQIVGVGG